MAQSPDRSSPDTPGVPRPSPPGTLWVPRLSTPGTLWVPRPSRWADFDETRWAINAAILAFAGLVAAIVVAAGGFDDPRPLYNGWVRLAGIAAVTSVFLLGVLLLHDRAIRRLQLCIVLSLVAHLGLVVFLHQQYLILPGTVGLGKDAEASEPGESDEVPDFRWENQVEEPAPETRPFAEPIPTELSEDVVPKLVESPASPSAVPVEERPIAEPQPLPPPEPVPAELPRVAVVVPEPVEQPLPIEPIRRQRTDVRPEPQEPIPSPEIKPQERRPPIVPESQIAAVDRQRTGQGSSDRGEIEEPAAARSQDVRQPERAAARGGDLPGPSSPAPPSRQIARTAEVPSPEVSAPQPGKGTEPPRRIEAAPQLAGQGPAREPSRLPPAAGQLAAVAPEAPSRVLAPPARLEPRQTPQSPAPRLAGTAGEPRRAPSRGPSSAEIAGSAGSEADRAAMAAASGAAGGQGGPGRIEAAAAAGAVGRSSLAGPPGPAAAPGAGVASAARVSPGRPAGGGPARSEEAAEPSLGGSSAGARIARAAGGGPATSGGAAEMPAAGIAAGTGETGEAARSVESPSSASVTRARAGLPRGAQSERIPGGVGTGEPSEVGVARGAAGLTGAPGLARAASRPGPADIIGGGGGAAASTPRASIGGLPSGAAEPAATAVAASAPGRGGSATPGASLEASVGPDLRQAAGGTLPGSGSGAPSPGRIALLSSTTPAAPMTAAPPVAIPRAGRPGRGGGNGSSGDGGGGSPALGAGGAGSGGGLARSRLAGNLLGGGAAEPAGMPGGGRAGSAQGGALGPLQAGALATVQRTAPAGAPFSRGGSGGGPGGGGTGRGSGGGSGSQGSGSGAAGSGSGAIASGGGTGAGGTGAGGGGSRFGGPRVGPARGSGGAGDGGAGGEGALAMNTGLGRIGRSAIAATGQVDGSATGDGTGAGAGGGNGGSGTGQGGRAGQSQRSPAGEGTGGGSSTLAASGAADVQGPIRTAGLPGGGSGGSGGSGGGTGGAGGDGSGGGGSAEVGLTAARIARAGGGGDGAASGSPPGTEAGDGTGPGRKTVAAAIGDLAADLPGDGAGTGTGGTGGRGTGGTGSGASGGAGADASGAGSGASPRGSETGPLQAALAGPQRQSAGLPGRPSGQSAGNTAPGGNGEPNGTTEVGASGIADDLTGQTVGPPIQLAAATGVENGGGPASAGGTGGGVQFARSGGGLTVDGSAAEPTEAFQQRAGTRRGRAARSGGGGQGTERAVEEGLDFFAKFQFPDGHWSLHELPPWIVKATVESDVSKTSLAETAADLLSAAPPAKGAEKDRRQRLTEMIAMHRSGGTLSRSQWDELLAFVFGPGEMQADTAATGLVLLTYQGAGYTHLEEKHQAVVSRGINWLVSHQKPSGDLFSGGSKYTWFYSHGIASIALCEAYGMTQDPNLREPARKAVEFIVRTQNTTRGGWRYDVSPGTGRAIETDMSVTGWQLMALKSAQMSGLPVPSETFQRIDRWLDSSQAGGQQGRYVYNPYADRSKPEQVDGMKPNLAMTAEAMLMRMYLGRTRNDPRLIDGAKYLKANLPAAGTIERPERDCYYWYYATQAMFQMQGDYWTAWNDRMRAVLEGSQVPQGVMAGSWHPREPVPDRWGHAGGRIYVTAMQLLMLEVYYRHLPLFQELTR